MAGPTAWQQYASVVNTSTQSITTTTETVIATLAGINSRSPGQAIVFDGGAFFAVNASTTSTTLRIRQDSLTGSVVGVAQVIAETAGTISQLVAAVAGQDTPSGEYAFKTYVLTIQAAAAAANW